MIIIYQLPMKTENMIRKIQKYTLKAKFISILRENKGGLKHYTFYIEEMMKYIWLLRKDRIFCLILILIISILPTLILIYIDIHFCLIFRTLADVKSRIKDSNIFKIKTVWPPLIVSRYLGNSKWPDMKNSTGRCRETAWVVGDGVFTFIWPWNV